ncbi:hypothetical protein VPHD85_0017 [Vibrio phage D85]|nr:hypothetical protein PODOV033v1_p0005 [Vibrio phage 252E42.2]
MGVADVTQAQLAREQWERYKSQFVPMLENLSGDLQSGVRLEESLALVPEQVQRSFEGQAQTLAAQKERMGIDSSQSESMKNQTGIEMAKAQSGSENLLRQSYTDMKKQAILGAGGGL